MHVIDANWLKKLVIKLKKAKKGKDMGVEKKMKKIL